MVAIVIPTLNEEHFIERCLDSVRQQSYPFEQMDVMVVDGGSTDRTCEIVKEYSSKYPNVRLLHNPQKIQSVAFNIGYQQSSAHILIRLDAHALYNKVYIERCVEHLNSDSSLGNVGGIWDIQPQGDGWVSVANALLNQSRFGIGGASYRIGAEKGYVDTVPFGAFPRKVIDKIGGMREDLPRGEDNEYNYRIRRAGYNILLDPQIVAVYFARKTIGSSMRQMYQNGVSIGKLAEINIDIIDLRHFIPILFLCALFVGGILSFVWKPFAFLYMMMIALYLLLDIIASSSVSIKKGILYIPALFVMFPLIHLSYGWGTLESVWGTVKRKYGLLCIFVLPFFIIFLSLKLLVGKYKVGGALKE